MSDKQPARLILKPPGAYPKLREVARAQGWTLVDTQRNGANHPLHLQETYTDASRTLGLRYVEDDLSGLHYFDVSGSAQAAAAATLAAELPLYTEDELLRSFDAA